MKSNRNTILPFNNNKIYWLLQLIGWGGYFIIGLAISLMFPRFGVLKTVLLQLFTISLMVLSTHWFRFYFKKRGWINLNWKKLIPIVLLTNLVTAVFTNVLTSFFMLYVLEVFSREQYSFGALGIYVFQTYIMFLFWTAIYLAVHYFGNYKRQEIEKWKLEAAVKDAELIALKSQINPHFIFNSLNNIRSLVAEDAEKARDMITHLSKLLRYSIQFNNQEVVKLEEEIQIVEDYLKLESIQLEDRLKYVLEIGEDTLSQNIPPMAIQLLVENGIKHGINLMPKGGEINIKSFLHDNNLHVEVINSGHLKNHKESNGIGLKNASDRLELLFGKLAKLSIQNIENEKVAARFSIPLQ